MEANTIYEGAPASAKDIESGPGAGGRSGIQRGMAEATWI